MEERDTYMAHELKNVSENLIKNTKGSAEPPVVVAIVGLAHINGIMKKFEKVSDQDVAKVVRIPPYSKSIAMKKLAFLMTAHLASTLFQLPVCFLEFALLSYCMYQVYTNYLSSSYVLIYWG